MFRVLIGSSLPRLRFIQSMAKNSRAESSQILVSGYTNEIALYKLDYNALTWTGKWTVEPNMTWIQQAAGSFWASHETGLYEGVRGGAVSRWCIENGVLTKKEFLNLENSVPAHLLIDLEHNLAYTANYGGGSVSVISLKNGKLNEVVQVLRFGSETKEKSHPHQIMRRGDLVWVVDLGLDKIMTFRVLKGQLEKIGEVEVQNGSGPRHLALHPTQDLAFLSMELKIGVLVYRVDYKTGDLTLQQRLPGAEADGDKGAAILVSEDGNTVYASSRGSGVICVYQSTGPEYVKVQELKVGGTGPRCVEIKDNIMLMTDQDGSKIQVITIDENGLLQAGQLLDTPPAPTFVMFYDN